MFICVISSNIFDAFQPKDNPLVKDDLGVLPVLGFATNNNDGSSSHIPFKIFWVSHSLEIFWRIIFDCTEELHWSHSKSCFYYRTFPHNKENTFCLLWFFFKFEVVLAYFVALEESLWIPLLFHSFAFIILLGHMYSKVFAL